MSYVKMQGIASNAAIYMIQEMMVYEKVDKEALNTVLAEAEAIRARLLAEAEGEKQLAEARASNEKVNFEIEKLKIEAQARIEIATKTAQIMAEIGKNAAVYFIFKVSFIKYNYGVFAVKRGYKRSIVAVKRFGAVKNR